MQSVPEAEAEMYVRGLPMRLDFAVEYHVLYHHARCQALIEPAHSWRWEQLAVVLERRFPPHLWHPGHWAAYEAHAMSGLSQEDVCHV